MKSRSILADSFEKRTLAPNSPPTISNAEIVHRGAPNRPALHAQIRPRRCRHGTEAREHSSTTKSPSGNGGKAHREHIWPRVIWDLAHLTWGWRPAARPPIRLLPPRVRLRVCLPARLPAVLAHPHAACLPEPPHPPSRAAPRQLAPLMSTPPRARGLRALNRERVRREPRPFPGNFVFVPLVWEGRASPT